MDTPELDILSYVYGVFTAFTGPPRWAYVRLEQLTYAVGMESTNEDVAQPTLQTLLAKAILLGTDEIELEYASEGLQVVYVRGQTGAGDVIASREATRAIIDDLFERAKLERKDRSGFKWAYARVEYTIRAEIYDSFGESAFRLTFKKSAHAR